MKKIRSASKARWSLSTIAIAAVSIAALSFTGCRAAQDRADAPAATAADKEMDTDERPNDARPGQPDDVQPGQPDDTQPGQSDDDRADRVHAESQPSDPAAPLTMDKVLELAQKGAELSWADLEGYAHTDVGSGLFCLHFPIDDQFALLMGGADLDSPPMYVRLMSAQDQSLYIDIREEDVQRFIDQVDLAAAANAQEIHRYVEIPAHIKEIHEDHILIRSDADRYPGAFTVSDAQGAAGTDTLKEGAGIRILMEDLHERDAQGLPCYRAEDILVLADADRPDTARADILLTAAPALTLSDTLSSTLNGFQVLSGSYTWTVLDGGQAQSVVACGSAPLAAETKDDIPRLRLPRYNGADQVLYSFNTQISPDLLTIRQWDSTAAGDPDAKEQMVTTCYQPLPFIQLEAGKIYEVSAEWDNSTADQKGFYGTASYMFMTE